MPIPVAVFVIGGLAGVVTLAALSKREPFKVVSTHIIPYFPDYEWDLLRDGETGLYAARVRRKGIEKGFAHPLPDVEDELLGPTPKSGYADEPYWDEQKEMPGLVDALFPDVELQHTVDEQYDELVQGDTDPFPEELSMYAYKIYRRSRHPGAGYSAHLLYAPPEWSEPAFVVGMREVDSLPVAVAWALDTLKDVMRSYGVG